MAKTITLNDLDRGWAAYKDLLDQHHTDIEYLHKVFNELYYKAYSTGGWILNKSLFIDTKPLFWSWCEATNESPDSFPDSTTLFWKEYWTFTLIVMALMFADNMAERARKKTNDLDWGFRFKLYDGHCDLLYITVNLINTRTGAHAPNDGADFYPSVRVYFPKYSDLKGLLELEMATGDFKIEFNPNVNIAEGQ